MQTGHHVTFDRYWLDLASEQLWCGSQEIPLPGKAFALLRYLVEHAGQLVSKADLFAALWPRTVVTDGALTFCVGEVRRALGDNPKAPQFIETVPRRGFRFIGKVASRQQPVDSSQEEETQQAKRNRQNAKIEDFSLPPSLQHPAPPLVGRETELAQLHALLDKAVHGKRQLIFVTGEPGIGKTTLVEAFLHGLASSVRSLTSQGHEEKQKATGKTQREKIETDPHHPTPDPWVARGQCIEQYGPGEPYMPILEALGRLGHESEGEHLISLLHQHAPTWLAQMPTLLQAAESEVLQRQTQGVTRERMLREMGEAIGAITAERPLVLWLEDLHWSDVSTLELLALLARRREPARLLVIGTYRPVDVIVQEHPLRTVKQELQLHGLCTELPLGLLSESQVAEYLTMRFDADGAQRAMSLQAVARLIHRRTDGNPLFMVNVVNALVAQRGEAHHGASLRSPEELGIGVPENLRQLIEQQLARVNSEERKILEAASIAGAEFPAATVAAGTERTTEAVETLCDDLVRREQFLRTRGASEWPDGTVAARYGFVHSLYQEVISKRIPASRRMRLHRQIGEREEQGYGDRAGEIAAELAVHFEEGRAYAKAVRYLQQAGENAIRRTAPREAISLLTKGLELLNTLPDTLERARQELGLQYALGTALLAAKGATAPEVTRVHTRTQALCQQVGITPPVFWVQLWLWKTSFHHPGNRTPREHAEQLLPLPYKGRDLTARLPPSLIRGVTLFFLGELASARVQLEEGITLYVPQQHRSAFHGIACLAHAAQTLWALGYSDQALTRSDEALTLAQEVGHPYSKAFARHWAAGLCCMRGEIPGVHTHAEALLSLSIQKGLLEWGAVGALWRGWALAAQGKGVEGMAQLGRGLASRRALGAELWWTYYLTLAAEASGKVGQVEEGLSLLAEALTTVEKTGERFYEAEIYRLRGELTLQLGTRGWGLETGSSSPQVPSLKSQVPSGVEQKAEECFLKAIDVARKQCAKSWELRATMSLARLRQQQARGQRAKGQEGRAGSMGQESRTTQHATRKKLTEAHRMLSEVYQWFTEGFDTKDLQEAKTLLEIEALSAREIT